MPFSVLAPSAPSKYYGRGPLPPSPLLRSAPSFARRMMCRRRRRVLASWLLGRWVGFRPLPPAPVLPLPVGTGTLWGILGFLPPWAPLTLWVCRRPYATRLPCPLRGAPPRGFLPLRRPRGPPPSLPLRGTRGPLRRTCGPLFPPPLPRFLLPLFLAGLPCVTFAPASPHGGPASQRRRRLWRGISFRCSRRPVHPPVALPPRFFACQMATPLACCHSLPAPL